MNETDKTQEETKAPGFFTSLGQRILVHFCAICMIAFANNSGDGGISICTYIGFICLFPRGPYREPNWFLPVAAGLAQVIILLALGQPFHAAILAGGIQTWLQRFLHGCTGLRDWLVAPMLALSVFGMIDDGSYRPGSAIFALASLPVILVGGYLAKSIYQRVRSAALHKTMLEQALHRLKLVSQEESLEPEIKNLISITLSQGLALEQAGLQNDEAGCKLIEQIDAMSRSVENVCKSKVTHSGWSAELFKSSAWGNSLGRLSGKKQDVSIGESLRQCNAAIMETLRVGAKSASRKEGKLDPLDSFEQQAGQLVLKARRSPKKIATRVESIAMLALEIVKGMRADPRDRPVGERFLQRYLPATSRIVDEYSKLADSQNKREDVGNAIARAEEVLERMENAFREELAAMLANDSVSFTAELNALDKLLQMGGH